MDVVFDSLLAAQRAQAISERAKRLTELAPS
jgi:hypothetical protein